MDSQSVNALLHQAAGWLGERGKIQGKLLGRARKQGVNQRSYRRREKDEREEVIPFRPSAKLFLTFSAKLLLI